MKQTEDRDEGKAALEADACRYCGKGLYQEEADRWGDVCDDCAIREGSPPAPLKAAADALREAIEDGYDEGAKAAIRAWLKALPGWRMVPVTLTAAMDQARIGVMNDVGRARVRDAWRRMSYAAPPPPGLEPDSERD